MVAAVITPDGSPVSQALVAAPMFVLYLIGIGRLAVRQSREKDETEVRVKSRTSFDFRRSRAVLSGA